MNIEEIRDFCLSKNGVEETFPFGEDTLVFKVMGKMFLLISILEPDAVNLKCDPEYSLELREKFSEITPGFHMNKKHWNTVQLNGSLDEKLIPDLIEHSYNLVVSVLPKKQKELLQKF